MDVYSNQLPYDDSEASESSGGVGAPSTLLPSAQDQHFANRKPLKMANPPPLRLTITLPTSRPIAAITGAFGPDAAAPAMVRKGIAKHELRRPIDEHTRIPQFTTNMPPRAGCAMTVGGAVPTQSVGSLHSVANRGWIEPHPTNLPRSVVARRAGDLSTTIVQRILAFNDGELLDGAAVLVCRQWHQAVTESRVLQARRFAFRPPTQPGVDGEGIICYLGCRVNHRGTSASIAVLHQSQTKSAAGKSWYNPAVGVNCPLKVACSHLSDERQVVSRVSLPTEVSARGKTARVVAAAPVSVIDDGYLPPLSNILSRGVSHFVTENLPFSWVGVDFGEFRVKLTHYTIGTSVRSLAPHPVSWELQATYAEDAPVGTDARNPVEDASGQSAQKWGLHTWFVLDKRSGDFFSDSGRRSATFEIDAAATALRGPVRKVRIVQTARNSQWGHELVISGLEFYGNLFRVPPSL